MRPYDPQVKFQYGDWLRANLKANRGGSAQPRGRIRFHDEAGSSNSQSGFSSLGEEHVFDGMGDVHTGHATFVNATPLRSVPAPATANSPMGVEENIVGVAVSQDVLAVDGSGKVHIEQNAPFGDESDAYVTKISHAEAGPVAAAPDFDAIEEWLADDTDSEVPVHTDLPVKVPSKRSSDPFWLGNHSSFYVFSEFTVASDHCLLFMNTNSTFSPSNHSSSMDSDSFHFEQCWSSLPECISLVQSTWASSSGKA
ncbi:hypothetical protein V6N13_148108 [Hibiscus sabdariffa]